VLLHYEEWGDPEAPPVVCVHGVQAYSGRFRRLAEERLAGRYHVVAVDLRGHGKSGRDEPWTLEAHVDDLRETFPSPAVWIGHSLGGRLIAELIARDPTRVKKAVLLDPALTVPPDYAGFLAGEELASDASYATPDEGVDDWTSGLLQPASDAVRQEIRDQLVAGEDGRYRFDYSPEVVAAGYVAVGELPPPWERAGIPTLIVAGLASKFVSVGEVEHYRAGLGDELELVIVPSGHSVLWDAFDETADAIERFLARPVPP
jgi:pimeloyl-ACP methyl ester carboxylesterase